MFKSGCYKIRFFKSRSLILSKDKGRYDTICAIETETKGILSRGVAYLHPNDSPNKITGKKIALAKTLSNMWLSKETKTEIWKDFFQWIESWKVKPDCFGFATPSDLCNKCSYFNQCVKKLWWDNTIQWPDQHKEH